MSANTPNVVIENPKVRKIARTVLDVIGILLGTALIIAPAITSVDLLQPLAVAMAVWTYLRFAFGVSVDNPNTPKIGKYGDYSNGAGK